MGIPNRSGRYGLCAARFENPRAHIDAMNRTARDILNELRWREPGRLADAVLWYRDRSRPEGVALIRGSEIVDLERRYFTTARARLPYYKVGPIEGSGETLFDRSRRRDQSLDPPRRAPCCWKQAAQGAARCLEC